VRGVRVYDDFAHHPTAIATTVDGLRRRVGQARILAVLELRSNTMRMGVHSDLIAPALAGADEVFIFTPPDLGWDTTPLLRELGTRGHAVASIDAMTAIVSALALGGDSVLVMSNGGFGGLHEKLLTALQERSAHDASATAP
jgi:UDP-N-acetylmuramate: L-alanyl-gamma-D-glutamyl-meso-diaminopimelate ligase